MVLARYPTERTIYYRKYILQITQPSQYRYTELQYRFVVISEALSTYAVIAESKIIEIYSEEHYR